jgi:hypothetical protein
MENKKIDFSRYRRPVEIDEFERQLTSTLHIRGQDEIERHPTFFRRQQEQEGRSNWSGGVWGGRGGHSG